MGAAAVSAGTVAVFAGLSVGGADTGLGPVAFAVSVRPQGIVAIRVVSTQASAARMTRQLKAKGVNIVVNAYAATPALVGTWLGASSDGRVPEALFGRVVEQTRGYASTVEVPASFPGHLSLDVGRAPHPGEAIRIAGLRNALAPGGPLTCRGLGGATSDAAQQTLVTLGYHVDFWATDNVISRDRQSSTAPAGTRVTEIFIHDYDPTDLTKTLPGKSRDVVILVAAPGALEYQAQLGQGFPPSQATATAPTTCGGQTR